MADNFNLRSFLSENNLTKNTQLLNEVSDYGFDELMDIVDIDYDGDPAIAAAVEDAFNSGQIDTSEFGHDISAASDAVARIANGMDIEAAQQSKNFEEGVNEDMEQAARDMVSKYGNKFFDLMDKLAANTSTKRPGMEEVVNHKQVNENKMTQREKYLTRLVENALGVAEGEENVDYTMGRHDDPDQLPNPPAELNIPEGDEMANETVIPEYKNIEELLKSIDHGTNEVAEAHKIQEMKKIAEALRMKAKKMEESEHAAHISPKDLKQLATDAAKLEKAAEKLKSAFDKKFNKKEKAPAAPKAQKVEALQENKKTMENFNLKKFLTENKLTTNSRMISEVGRSVFGLETEGLGDRIGNAVSGVGAKLAGGNSAILQKMITTAGIKVGVPIYSKDGKEVYVIKNIDYKTGDASISVTVNNVEDQSKSKYESRVMTDSFKDILNAAPEEAQRLADKEVEQVKRTFAQGDISYQKPA